MNVLCQIDVTLPNHGTVTVQVEDTGGVLSLRQVKRGGEVEGCQLEAEPELAVRAPARWPVTSELDLKIGVRSAP